MLAVLILVCSLLITPHERDCSPKNAVDVIRMKGEVASPIICGLHGQAYLAGTAIGRELRDGEFVRVVCRPIHQTY